MSKKPEAPRGDLGIRLPDRQVSVRETFGLNIDMKAPAFSERSEHVPEVDKAYRFDHDTTIAILAGFAHNRRVLIQGYHGTGKSTHIEQVAADTAAPDAHEQEDHLLKSGHAMLIAMRCDAMLQPLAS